MGERKRCAYVFFILHTHLCGDFQLALCIKLKSEEEAGKRPVSDHQGARGIGSQPDKAKSERKMHGIGSQPDKATSERKMRDQV